MITTDEDVEFGELRARIRELERDKQILNDLVDSLTARCNTLETELHTWRTGPGQQDRTEEDYTGGVTWTWHPRKP